MPSEKERIVQDEKVRARAKSAGIQSVSPNPWGEKK